MSEHSSQGGPTRGRAEAPSPRFNPVASTLGEQPASPTPPPGSRPRSRSASFADAREGADDIESEDEEPEGPVSEWTAHQLERHLVNNFKPEELDKIFLGGTVALWGVLHSYGTTRHMEGFLEVFQRFLPHFDWIPAKDARTLYRQEQHERLRSRRAASSPPRISQQGLTDPRTPKQTRILPPREHTSPPTPPRDTEMADCAAPSTSKGKAKVNLEAQLIAESVLALKAQIESIKVMCDTHLTPEQKKEAMELLSQATGTGVTTKPAEINAPNNATVVAETSNVQGPQPPIARGRNPIPINRRYQGRGASNVGPSFRSRNMPPIRNSRKPSLASRISDPSPNRSRESTRNPRSYAAAASTPETEILKKATDILTKAPAIGLEEAVAIARTFPIETTRKKRPAGLVQGTKASNVVVRGEALLPERLIPMILDSLAQDQRVADLPQLEVTLTVDRKGVLFRGKAPLRDDQREAVKDALALASQQPSDSLTFLDRYTHTVLRLTHLPRMVNGFPLTEEHVVQALLRVPAIFQEAIMETKIISNPNNAALCTAMFKVYDDRKGTFGKQLTRHTIVVAGEHRRIQEWVNKPTTRQCTQCQRWGHVMQVCHAPSPYCAICAEPHPTSTHYHACNRCAQQGVQATFCEHRYCINCHGNHEATARECPWFIARNKPEDMKNLMERKQKSDLAARNARTSAQRYTMGSAPRTSQLGVGQIVPPVITGNRFTPLTPRGDNEDSTIPHA